MIRKTIRENRQLWSVLRGMIPVMILTNLATMLGSFVDGIVVGTCLGDVSMSAMGLSIPVVYLGSAIAGVFSSGTQNRCATAIGNGNPEEANRYFNTSMGFLCLIGAVLTIAIELFAGPIAAALGARAPHENLKPDLVLYLRGIGLSIPLICLTNTLSSLLYVVGKKRVSLIAITVGMVFNAAGDLAAVYVFHAGMLGIGLSTALCYLVSAGVLLTQFTGKGAERSSLRIRLSAFDPKGFPGILKVGVSMAFVRICHMTRTWIINTILGFWFFQAAITAFSVQNSLVSMVTCVCVGAGAAAMTVSSVYAGEKNVAGLKNLMRMAVMYGLGLSILVAAGCAFARYPLVSLFTKSSEVADYAADAFLGYLISMPLYSVNMTFMLYFQGIRRLKTANIVCFFDNLFYVCVAAAVLGSAVGLNGIWAAFPVGEVCTLITLAVMARIYHRRPVRKFEDLLQLPEEPDPCEMNRECENLSRLVDVSREAGAFALSRGADEKAANTISLCIEEYGKNIMEWGFREKVDPLLNVRLIRDGGKWRIYLKDAGRRFDPLAWLQEHGAAPKVAGEQIGIRLTAGLAADLKYVQELGLNAVIITVDDASRGADDRPEA